MPNLELLKAYLRIDGSEDDQLLTLLMDAAKEDLRDSGVAILEPAVENAQYDLAVMLYCALHYENRDPGLKIEKLNVGYQNLILKLKNYERVVIIDGLQGYQGI